MTTRQRAKIDPDVPSCPNCGKAMRKRTNAFVVKE